MKYANLILGVICIATFSCTYNTLDPDHIDYPMQIISVNGFTKEQSKKIRKYSDELNKLVGATVIVHKDSDQRVKVSYKAFIPNDDKKKTILGTMSMDDEGNCIIKLTQNTANDDEWLHMVIWHELGHCIGLPHLAKEHEVMSPIATLYSDLTPGAIKRFADSVRALHK